MKHAILIILYTVLLGTTSVLSQLTITSTTPTDGAINVPLLTTVSLTFSAALDTTKRFDYDIGMVTNLPPFTSKWYSANSQTVYLAVNLQPSTIYFMLVYYAPGLGGANLQQPIVVEFTTGSVFTGHSVSGTIFSGTTGVSAKHALVVLSSTPIDNQGPPLFVCGTYADTGGVYTIPHVSNGTYYPVCAKDVNGDGNIDPAGGDVIGLGNPIVVNNGNVAGVDLTFTLLEPLTFSRAKHIADSIKTGSLPNDALLRMVQSWDVDSLGRAQNWGFFYTSVFTDTGYEVRPGSFGSGYGFIDSGAYHWIRTIKPITNLAGAALADSFVAKTEANGGSTFRHQPKPDTLQFSFRIALGQLSRADYWQIAPDTGQLYWGATYSLGFSPNQNSWKDVITKKFIGDYATGDVLVVSGIADDYRKAIPTVYSLNQNYPNPFNPSTSINFSLPERSFVTITIFNLLGQEVLTLIDGEMEAGEHTALFDASKLSSGVYFYRLQAQPMNGKRSDKFVQTRKLLLLK